MRTSRICVVDSTDLFLSYEQNATDSPLLRLPPELRNRIWCMVLGGKTIHVNYMPSYWSITDGTPRAVHSICQTSTDDHVFAADIKALEFEEEFTFVHYEDRHQKCQLWGPCTRPLDDLHLGVLQVCRQIHQEAALLPYQDNTFSTWDPDSLTMFLKVLLPAQARAIRSIVLNVCADDHDDSKAFATLLQNNLHGLQQLSVFAPFWNTWHTHLFYEVKAAGGESGVAGALLAFERLPIQSAIIAAYNKQEEHYQPPRYAPAPRSSFIAKSDLSEWAAEMEKRLTTPWDQAAFNARVAAEQAGKEEAERARKKQNRAGGRLRPAKS